MLLLLLLPDSSTRSLIILGSLARLFLLVLTGTRTATWVVFIQQLFEASHRSRHGHGGRRGLIPETEFSFLEETTSTTTATTTTSSIRIRIRIRSTTTSIVRLQVVGCGEEGSLPFFLHVVPKYRCEYKYCTRTVRICGGKKVGTLSLVYGALI